MLFAFIDYRKEKKMRKTIIFFVCLGFFIPFLISSELDDYYRYSFARISYVNGDVFVKRVDDLGYEEAQVNLPIVEEESIGSREGYGEVHFGKNNYLRIDRYTQVEFPVLPARGNDLVKIHLISGSIYLRINLLDIEKGFEIHAPDASFYILEKGLFRIDVDENKQTELRVFSGSVETAGEEGSVLVSSEERVIASNGYLTLQPVVFDINILTDEFSQWNEKRDSIYFARKTSNNYLPDELYEYEDELAYYGTWSYQEPYGYVWRPRIYRTDWRPYYFGRWVWYPICGWTWVSYDPWGWSVYHYGRWHWRANFGWYWIPRRRWRPAWVYWYRGSHHYGWCPLSYYGHPVVIINNHFYGRRHYSHYPLRSRALVMIHKNQLRDPNISRVALSRSRLGLKNTISLSSTQPEHRPKVDRLSRTYMNGSKVFSETHKREISQKYSPNKDLSRHSIDRTRISSDSIRNSNGRLPSNELRGERNTREFSRNSNLRRDSSGVSREIHSENSIKTYPSRRSTIRSENRSELNRINSGRNPRSERKNSYSGNRDSSSRVKIYPSRRKTSPYVRKGSSRGDPPHWDTMDNRKSSVIDRNSSRSKIVRSRTGSSDISRNSSSSRSRIPSYKPREKINSPKSPSSRTIKRSRSSVNRSSNFPKELNTKSHSSSRSSVSRSSYPSSSRSSVNRKVTSRSSVTRSSRPSRRSTVSRSRTSSSRSSVNRKSHSSSRSSINRSRSSSRSHSSSHSRSSSSRSRSSSRRKK